MKVKPMNMFLNRHYLFDEEHLVSFFNEMFYSNYEIADKEWEDD